MYLYQACSNVNYFPQKAVLVAELKKLESRNLNRKINITWHQSISKIGPNGVKLIYKTQITYLLYPLFTTLEI